MLKFNILQDSLFIMQSHYTAKKVETSQKMNLTSIRLFILKTHLFSFINFYKILAIFCPINKWIQGLEILKKSEFI